MRGLNDWQFGKRWCELSGHGTVTCYYWIIDKTAYSYINFRCHKSIIFSLPLQAIPYIGLSIAHKIVMSVKGKSNKNLLCNCKRIKLQTFPTVVKTKHFLSVAWHIAIMKTMLTTHEHQRSFTPVMSRWGCWWASEIGVFDSWPTYGQTFAVWIQHKQL